ncbi:MAG: SirB2 family protein [Pseudobdellovibrio sp.]
MPYEFYKIIHVVSIVLLFSGLMGLLTVKMSKIELAPNVKRMVFISHGVGVLFLLISGFGLLARLGLTQGLPGWVYGKLAIWLVLAGSVALVKRKGHLGWPIFICLIAIFTVAAYLAILKPF